MTTEFLNDPIVPLELTITGGKRFTLYQPGWYTADDGSAGFLGTKGQVYGFRTLDDLVSFVDSSTPTDLSPSQHLRPLRIWPAEEYARKLCSYDLINLPEIADGELDADEQASLGSTLALMLDLLDYMDVDDPHAQALHDDEDISKLASGDEVLSIFRAAHHRKHVVEILDANWSWCLAEVSRRIVVPDLPESPVSSSPLLGGAAGSAAVSEEGDGSVPLEDATDAMTLWFGLAEEGFYAVRSTSLHDGIPHYAGTPDDAGIPRLTVWTDLDRMRTDLTSGPVAGLSDGRGGEVALNLLSVLDRPDVSLTPHDDSIFDLVLVADSLTEEMDHEAADKLVSAWTELSRLADWGGWTDLAELLSPESPAGRFVISCAVDLAQDRPGAAQALATADVKAAAAGWQAVLPVLTAHLDQQS
ncbi:hypothetical protein ABN028_27060 [Actinopolymorpha sp. B17G11]|uniref:hypothetical protein n=1 Tax=unclassified Actinopolymorpha TaxID=2627063 RepID=UPI0032D8CE3F